MLSLRDKHKKKFDIYQANDLIQKVVDEFKKLNIFKPEPYRFFLKEGFDTASWSYRPPHYIVIGTEIFEDFIGTEQQKSDFFLMFVLHEVAHSIYTDYRIFKIIKTLEERDLPFSVFNLFEDARIESTLFKKNKISIIENFNWSKYISLEKPSNSLDLFYWCVQKNGSKKSFDSIYSHLNKDLQKDSQRVWEFYQKTIDAKDSFEVIDIVEEWMKTMHEEILNISKNLFYGEIEILNSPDSIISQIKGATEVATITINDLKSKQMSQNSALSFKNLYSIKNLTSKDLLSKEIQRDEFDKVLIQKIKKEIERLFVSNNKYTKTSTPSKRLNLRNMLLKNPNIYKKNNVTELKKEISIILDISGSMSGVIEEMLIIVEVFNILAKKGLIKGHLILSVSLYSNEASYQTFKFPLDKDVLKKIITYGATEGLAEVMKHLSKLLKPCDGVLVFTDGLFADDPLNKEFFYKNNIDLYGIFYDGTANHGYDLEQYFDNSIVDKDIEILVFKIVKMLKLKFII